MAPNSNNDPNRLITLAIHTYDRAVILKTRLEKAGVTSVLHNVNLSEPVLSAGVRVRICEKDLPKALTVVESDCASTANESLRKKIKVLIPIDFSDYSLKSCIVGFEYARRNNGSVVLLHAYMNAERKFALPFGSDRYERSGDDDNTLRTKALLAMKDFRLKLEKMIVENQLSNVAFETAVREGVPEQCVLQCADEVKAQLIVMGTAGASQKERAALGSVTAEVLDACKFPIMAIPKHVEVDRLANVKNVAFFSNLIPNDLLSFDLFSHLLSVQGMKVSIIPVVEKRGSAALTEEAKEQLMNYCTEHYPQCDFKLTELALDDNLDELERFTNEKKIDLIVIPNKKTNIFARLFNPSIAHKVLFSSDTPLLVVPV